jgi:hypothetical protein
MRKRSTFARIATIALVMMAVALPATVNPAAHATTGPRSRDAEVPSPAVVAPFALACRFSPFDVGQFSPLAPVAAGVAGADDSIAAVLEVCGASVTLFTVGGSSR